MTATNETLSMATEAQLKRDLPQSIVIPPIRGEMVHLRPATVEDLPRLDELDAFYGASRMRSPNAPSYTRGSAAPRLGKPVRHPPNPVWVIRNPAAPSHGPY